MLYHYNNGVIDNTQIIWEKGEIIQPPLLKRLIGLYEVFETAKDLLSRKKPDLDISMAMLKEHKEGLCAQIMHIGPYDDEHFSVNKLEEHIKAKGYKTVMEGWRQHHEIYLSDPRKSAPEKLKTIIRHPIVKR